MTGNWETFVEASATISNPPTASTTLYLVFKGGSGYLFDVDAFTFATGTGSSAPASTLRAQVNSQYVSAVGSTALIANKASVSTTEQFDRVDAGNGAIALRSRANGLYVSAENAGAEPLIANRTSVGAWETFQLITNSDGTVSLRATINNQIVAAENAGAGSLIANRTSVGAWERFILTTS